MKTLSHILQLALLAFLLIYLMFFIFFDVLGPAFGMDPILPDTMVKVFLTGMILSLTSWGSTSIYTKGLLDKQKKTEIEMNAVKAKLYDLEHPKSPQVSKPVPQKNQEETGGIIRPRQNFTDQ
jgi:hypothetical protein